MASYTVDSEEEALFRSYPYALYFVQSPSAISHANTYEVTYNSPPQPENYANATRLALSRYSSSRGSNNSFLHENDKKCQHGMGVAQLENGETGGVILENGIVRKSIRDEYKEEDDDFGDYESDDRGLWKYFSFSYSNSGWWICLQLCWRLLLSLIIALLVFYVLAKPPAPRVSLKVARIRQFRLGEGVDSHGVPTKVLNFNCTIDLMIDNKSKLFGLHIHPPMMAMLFDHVPFASSQGGELYAESDDTTLFKLRIGTINKAMYGAGRSMQDLLESVNGLPLIIRLGFKSSSHVVWGLIEPKFYYKAQCLLLLTNTYDKKNRTQVYSSKCVVNLF